MAEASAAGAAGPKSFLGSVVGSLAEAERAALLRVRWHDRLVSLWAPVTVLALLFLGYTAVIELGPCNVSWGQPLMQAVGAVCFWWWAALVVARFVLRGWNGKRKVRYAAEEFLRGLEALVKRHRAQVPEKARADLAERTAALLRAFGQDASALQAAFSALERAADSHLAKLGGASGDVITGFAKALLIALLVRSVLIEPFRIPSGSMIPTLEIGDQIFVNKFLYGVRIPFTNTVPFVLVREPARGDVIVFNNPVQPDRDFIKRIVGVPGDRLEFHGRDVVVNGQAFPQEIEDPEHQNWDQPPPPDSIPAWLRNWFVNDWTPRAQTLSRETIDGRPHYVQHEPYAPTPLGQVIVVPPKSVFVMGDNRDHSADSRFGLGEAELGVQFVPFGHIKGKAMVVWLSLSHGGLFASIFGGTGFRLDRFAQPITLCGEAKRTPR